MSLWCDKYRPKKLADLDYNLEQADQLKRLVRSPNFPHLGLFGCSGSGKKTRVNALLHELFDASAAKLRLETRIYEAPSGKKIEQRFVSSNYHVEVNPSEAGFYDRVVVQEVIRDQGSSHSLTKKHPFKVIVILEADRLSREAQQALRRTLEKYIATCRVILVGERISKMIPALRSRCLTVRNPAPTNEMVRQVLERVSSFESFGSGKNSHFSVALDQIVTSSDRNLRRAILMLQAFACQSGAGLMKNSSKSTPTIPLITFRWQDQIGLLAKKLTESQTVRKVPEMRTILYELQTHLVPADLILRTLTRKLLPICLDDQMRSGLIRAASQVDARIALGSKPIIHLELFCVQFMAMFRCAVENMDFDDTMDMD